MPIKDKEKLPGLFGRFRERDKCGYCAHSLTDHFWVIVYDDIAEYMVVNIECTKCPRRSINLEGLCITFRMPD